jgi:hypothetical protein
LIQCEKPGCGEAKFFVVGKIIWTQFAGNM